MAVGKGLGKGKGLMTRVPEKIVGGKSLIFHDHDVFQL